MNLDEHFRAMARNRAWSNARLHGACARLSEDEFAAERKSFFPSLPLTLNHILMVDRETAGAILAHLFTHQTHHRGQARAMLAVTRVAPPQRDEFFLAADEPRRSAELRRLGF